MLSPSDFNNAVPQFTNGNYASNPINPQYIAEPDAESYNRGTEPLQTLPAQWWNWFVNKFTARFNKVNIYVKNIFNELAQVLSIFNITPDGTEQTPTTSQLKTVFECCYPKYVKNDLYGNIAGTALGTAAVGTATTFARSDHVHPMPTCVACAGTASYLIAPSATGICTDINGNFIHKDNATASNWHVDSYGGNAVFAVYFEQNYVYAPLFCGNLAGNAATSTTTSYMNAPSADGVYTDINGNFRHKSTGAAQYWHVDRYDGTSVFAVYFEQNYVCAPLFCGNLSGNATTTSFLTSPGQYGVCSDNNGNLHQKEFTNGANYQIFDYQNNPVMRVFFAENYVCAATFCGNLSGIATKANYLQSIYEGGVISDDYGNLKHNNNCSGNSWNIYNNAGQPMMTVQLENSVVTAAKFCGNLAGTATNATYACSARIATKSCYSNIYNLTSIQTCFVYYYLNSDGFYHICGDSPFLLLSEENGDTKYLPQGDYNLITQDVSIINKLKYLLLDYAN